MKNRDQKSGIKNQEKQLPVCRRISTTNLRNLFIVAALAAIVPSGLQAQQNKPWEKIPTPKLHEFHPQQPKRIELKNGIVVFLQEDHELPFVSGLGAHSWWVPR